MGRREVPHTRYLEAHQSVSPRKGAPSSVPPRRPTGKRETRFSFRGGGAWLKFYCAPTSPKPPPAPPFRIPGTGAATPVNMARCSIEACIGFDGLADKASPLLLDAPAPITPSSPAPLRRHRVSLVEHCNGPMVAIWLGAPHRTATAGGLQQQAGLKVSDARGQTLTRRTNPLILAQIAEMSGYLWRRQPDEMREEPRGERRGQIGAFARHRARPADPCSSSTPLSPPGRIYG